MLRRNCSKVTRLQERCHRNDPHSRIQMRPHAKLESIDSKAVKLIKRGQEYNRLTRQSAVRCEGSLNRIRMRKNDMSRQDNTSTQDKIAST